MRKALWSIPGAGAVVLWMSCDPIAPVVEPTSLTTNSCPEHPCQLYSQAGTLPDCNEGRCTVCEGVDCIQPSSEYVLLVSLPTDAAFAPGITYAVPLNSLPTSQPTFGCALPGCTGLPNVGVVRGYYSVTQQEQVGLGWNLGSNPLLDTVVPAQATYRLISPVFSGLNPCEAPPQSTALPSNRLRRAKSYWRTCRRDRTTGGASDSRPRCRPVATS